MERSEGKRSAPMSGHNHLQPRLGVTPLAVASFLGNQFKTMPPEETFDLFRIQPAKARGHPTWTSLATAPSGRGTGEGSK